MNPRTHSGASYVNIATALFFLTGHGVGRHMFRAEKYFGSSGLELYWSSRIVVTTSGKPQRSRIFEYPSGMDTLEICAQQRREEGVSLRRHVCTE